MEGHGGADTHLQPMEDPMLEQMDAWRMLWSYGKPTLEQIPSRTCGSPVERGAHWSGFAGRFLRGTTGVALHEEGKDPGWRILGRTISHGKDPTLEWNKGVKSPPMEEEGVANTDDDL